MTDAAPLETHRETVRADWVDYNGHMNVAYYVMVFDHATDVFLNGAGLGRDYRENTGSSVFVVEAERIRRRNPELLARGRAHPEGACAFLDDAGACRIYEQRPYVWSSCCHRERWIGQVLQRMTQLMEIGAERLQWRTAQVGA